MPMLVGTTGGLVDPAGLRTVAHEDHEVLALAGPWAVLDGREVVDRDGRRAPLVEVPRVTCLAELGDGGVIAGTAEAHLYRLADGHVERLLSFDDAEGRADWYTPWGGPPAVRSVAVSPRGALLANVHVGGVLRSADDGASWQPTIDLDHDVHQVVARPGQPVVAACADGLAVSYDDGATWAVHDDGLHATYARAVALSGDALLLSVSAGPMGERAALYRRPVAGEGPFERCRAGLPEWFEGNIDTFWLDGDADGAAAFATADGTIYASADAGRTWDQTASGVTGVRCLALQ